MTAEAFALTLNPVVCMNTNWIFPEPFPTLDKAGSFINKN